MTRISRVHPVRFAIVVCAMTALGSLSFSPPAAGAGLLGQVTGSVEEVVSPVVPVPPPVREVGESVTTTVQGVTAKVAPPAAKAPGAAAPPPADSAGALGDGADAIADRARSTVSGAVSSAGTATEAVEGTAEAAREDAEAASGAAGGTSAVPSAVDSTGAVARAPSTAPRVDSSATPTDRPPAEQRTTYLPPPTENGATDSPLPRWVAYVWPAVALTGPYLASFGERWERAITGLATEASAGDGGKGGEGGVAGVHAAGGRPEAADSAPLFSRLPSDVGHAFSSVPTPMLIYLGVLVLAVIAVALAVRREIAIGRRQ